MKFVSGTSSANWHLALFSATKVLYNINDLGGLAIFQCPADLLGTCLRLFIDGHNPQFHCIKGKWHGRRHLYYMFWAPGEGKIFYNPKGSQNETSTHPVDTSTSN